MEIDLAGFKKEAAARKNDLKGFFKKLKKVDARTLDDKFHRVHYEVFDETDCLTCANCCKTTSPIFYQRDIERAAGALRIKPGAFIEAYLLVDEDRDYVLQTAPCPFLAGDNTCNIYEDRPAACREYPHTDRKKVVQILDLTLKNTQVCPAVLEMTRRLEKIF